MRPYYKQGNITIYNGDCMDILEYMPMVDAIITDPPYGETSLRWDVPTRKWLSLAQRRLLPSGSVWFFTSLRALLAMAPDLDEWIVAQELVWEKHNGSSFHNDRFKRVHEFIVQIYPAETKWEAVYKNPVTTPDAVKKTVRRKERPIHMGHIERSTYTSEEGGPRLMRSVIQHRSCHGYAVHETQKPIGVVAPLIRYSCPDAGIVLDPFMGSGTTLVAAKELGCRAIGIEKNEKDCEKAVFRLSQTMLFTCRMTNESPTVSA